MSDYKPTVYKDKTNDTYRVSYTYISPDGKKHRTCKRGFEKKKDAEKWVKNDLPAIIREKEASRTPDKMMTMGELIEEYMQDLLKKNKINENTYENKKMSLNRKFSRIWGIRLYIKLRKMTFEYGRFKLLTMQK